MYKSANQIAWEVLIKVAGDVIEFPQERSKLRQKRLSPFEGARTRVLGTEVTPFPGKAERLLRKIKKPLKEVTTRLPSGQQLRYALPVLAFGGTSLGAALAEHSISKQLKEFTPEERKYITHPQRLGSMLGAIGGGIGGSLAEVLYPILCPAPAT